MLKTELNPFEHTDIAHLTLYPIRFVSLELEHSKIRACSLFLFSKKDATIKKILVAFKGRFFQHGTILTPEHVALADMSKYDSCYIQTDQYITEIGYGLSRKEGPIVLRYSHK